MITYIKIDGFKSFRNFEMYFSPFTVIAGVNASGKSNLFDALNLLSDLSSDEPIQKVLSNQRGEMHELFTLYDNNQRSEQMFFAVEMLVNPTVVDEWGQQGNVSVTRLRYEVCLKYIGIDNVEIIRESLTAIRKKDDIWSSYLPSKTDNHWRPPLKATRQKPFLKLEAGSDGNYKRVEIYDNNSKPEVYNLRSTNKTIISRFNKIDNPHLLSARQEMMSWRFLHLNPADLRQPSVKGDVNYDLESTGKNLASTLIRLKKEDSYNLVVVSQLIRKFIPDFIGIDVREDADGSRYVIYVKDRKQREYTSRVLSEGTLRILALCVLAVDSHHSGLLCFEEPENGVHPMRLVSMAELMCQLTSDFLNTELKLRQVLINTHSPRFVEEVFRLKNPLTLVVLTRRVTCVINEGPMKTTLQTTRMTPIVSDGKSDFPLSEQPSAQELELNRHDMLRYLNKTELKDILG